MKVYHCLKIVPAIPRNCVTEDELHHLAQIGFYPQAKGNDNDKIIFMAPTYCYDQGDRKYNFINNEGCFEISPEGNSLHAILGRIMLKTGLSYVYLTKVDQLIYKQSASNVI